MITSSFDFGKKNLAGALLLNFQALLRGHESSFLLSELCEEARVSLLLKY